MGPITALTWALEIGDYTRFHSVKQAISYCGLCGAEKSSADKMMRMPISKQRNKHIQHVLVEAAKLAPRYCHELALLREQGDPAGEQEPGHTGGSQKDGGLHARGGPQTTGLRASRGDGGKDSGVKDLSIKEKTYRIIRCAGCQVPQLPAGRRRQLPRPPSDCFGTGREHKLNLLRRLFGARGSKWMSGPAGAGTTSREAHVRRRMTRSDGTRALLSAPGNLVLFS